MLIKKYYVVAYIINLLRFFYYFNTFTQDLRRQLNNIKSVLITTQLQLW